MRYYNAPPPIDLPTFMYKGFYGLRLFESLVAWADNEYLNALQNVTRKGRIDKARILADEWSGMRVLSQMDNFRWVCAQLDEDTWKRLSRKTRRFIRKAYELYELLRN